MTVGITMGDPNGVGPELILRAHRDRALDGEYCIVGDLDILDYCNRHLGLDVQLQPIDTEIRNIGSSSTLQVLDQRLLSSDSLQIGRVSREAGAAARAYVHKATELALKNEISAITTLPMNKEATRLSDPEFTGHTELIAQLCGRKDITMMLASDQLIVTHVSTHVPLSEAVLLVTEERIHKVIELTHEALVRLKKQPIIAVAALNPHAGEGGHFGTEEREYIAPAVERARSDGIDVSGPFPPDVIFRQAIQGAYKAVVCMYHDQGHIPVKLLDFEGGVNITLGLQIIRTSVDHGTAFDIAYQGRASTRSLVAAYSYARALCQQREYHGTS